MERKIKSELIAGKLAEYEQLTKIYDDIVQDVKPRLTVEGQGKVLLALADEDHLSQSQISSRLEISPQSTGEFVSKLAKRDLVSLSKSENDRRINLVSLTTKGREEIESSFQEVPKFITILSNEEMDQFNRLITKIIAAMYEDIDKANPTLGVKFHKLLANRYLKQYKK
ncbi:MarR family winged helix-turn-helix transcriptional regulator [Leuconostoc pseudomesenteroides]|uniref:MarR family transcriptional regulator n=1 Tax=Leuconostoc pseudomesenteroides TaxID=33968 RepID=UPI00403DDF2F